MSAQNKPFIVVLNTKTPKSEETKKLAKSLQTKIQRSSFTNRCFKIK